METGSVLYGRNHAGNPGVVETRQRTMGRRCRATPKRKSRNRRLNKK